MKNKKKKPLNKTIWIASAAVALVIAVGTGLLINMLLMGGSPNRNIKKQVQMLRLQNPPPPPPPPKVEEKPIQPEVKPKESFKMDKFEAPRSDAPPQANSKDAKAPGKDLGLDARRGPGL